MAGGEKGKMVAPGIFAVSLLMRPLMAAICSSGPSRSLHGFSVTKKNPL